MSDLRFINPEAIAPPPGGGFTHVVEVRGSGRTVYIAGQLGSDRAGSLAAGDFRSQAIQAFENLAAALASVGATFEHVVKVNNYLVDMKHLPILREVRNRYFNMSAPPASTTVAVSALARDKALYEIDAVAILEANAGGHAG